MTNGGQILVKTLQAHKVDRVFCVAGESYLPVLDALLDYPEIQVITCRHESGATFMAEAHAKLTGKPAVAMVTRGPGACNGSIGIHAAMQSSAPVVLFVGLINTMDRDKEAFQEFDLKQMFSALGKWTAVIDKGERIAEYTARALHVAGSGRPGPVVIGLPEEILFNKAPEQDIKIIPHSEIVPSEKDLSTIRDMLAKAKRPLVLVGGGNWSDADCAALVKFADSANIPVAASMRCQDVFDHENENYIGELGFGPNPKLVEQVKSADVILAMGTRIDEVTSQAYTLFQKGQKIMHVCVTASEFGKAVIPDVAVQSYVGPVAQALAKSSKIDGAAWKSWRDENRQNYVEWGTLKPTGSKWKGADITEIYQHLLKLLPKNAVVTTDAGNFAGWPQRFIRFGRPGRQLAPVSGAMGYGVPSAIAASLQYPDRVVLGVCGDGGFMMTGQEIATAMMYGAKPIILVCNNGIYGTIRMHQEREYPGRPSATTLLNPDFVKLAESYGAFGARVDDAKDFPDVWNRAVKSGTLALIEITMDPRQITTGAKL
jgi:acetolactate synthase I/II/III large subunit